MTLWLRPKAAVGIQGKMETHKDHIEANPAAGGIPALTHERAGHHEDAWRNENISLCETLDRVLNKGVVVLGEAVVSVANVDLLYLGLNVVLTSVETANRMRGLQRDGGTR